MNKLEKTLWKLKCNSDNCLAVGGHQVPEEHALCQEAQQEGAEGSEEGEKGRGSGSSSTPCSGTSYH